jgi:L-ascorbate metabolism protein UlaG (beta-lactamase superfamily)
MVDVESASLTWIGHATALVELDGERLLIDPFGRKRCSMVEGYRAVLITHAHTDHLNRWTLSTLDRSARLIVPSGAFRFVEDLDFADIIEVEPGEQLSIAGIEINAVPTRHDPGRWRKGDGPCCTGYVLCKSGIAIHHSGDIDMSEYRVFEQIGNRFSLDVTMLPIGGWLPVWYYRSRRKALDRGVHIDPDTALHIAQLLRARKFVPIPWGTLHARFGSPGAPLRRLLAVAEKSDVAGLVHVLGHGESLELHPPR